MAGLGRDLGIPVADDLASVIDECDTLIDVSSVEQCLRTLDLAVEHGKALVTASTGFTPEQFARFEAAGERIPADFECNTSKMVNVMLALGETAARALADECDIEIIDQHDRDKLDAPSGTAVIIGNMIAELKGTTLDELAEYGRAGHGARKPGGVGFRSLAPATSRSDHKVYFGGLGERLEITHYSTATTASPAAPSIAPSSSTASPPASTPSRTSSGCAERLSVLGRSFRGSSRDAARSEPHRPSHRGTASGRQRLRGIAR